MNTGLVKELQILNYLILFFEGVSSASSAKDKATLSQSHGIDNGTIM